MLQVPLQCKPHLDPNQKAARVPRGRMGSEALGPCFQVIREQETCGLPFKPPANWRGSQRSWDHQLVHQGANEITVSYEQRRPRQKGRKQGSLRDVQWGGGSRENSKQGKGKSSPSHPVPPALKSVSPGQVDSKGSHIHGARTGAHTSPSLLPLALRWHLALPSSSLSSKESSWTFPPTSLLAY